MTTLNVSFRTADNGFLVSILAPVRCNVSKLEKLFNGATDLNLEQSGEFVDDCCYFSTTTTYVQPQDLWGFLTVLERSKSLGFQMGATLDGIAIPGGLDQFIDEHMVPECWLSLPDMDVFEDLIAMDPTYEPNSSLSVRATETRHGRWHARVLRKLVKGSEVKNWEILAWHEVLGAEPYNVLCEPVTYERYLCNDSGWVGVFKVSHQVVSTELFGGTEQLPTASRLECGELPAHGWLSRSGFGDGSYAVKVVTDDRGLVTALRVVFIDSADFTMD